jgi:diacylglycerol kinase family enzyme
MTCLVLLNASSGSIQRSRNGGFDRLVREGLQRRGIAAEVRLVKSGRIAKAAQAFLARAAESQGDDRSILVIGGGDGTIGSVASVLAGTDVALGILPLGTRNHFARDLGLPIDLEAAMDVIAAGHGAAVDIAEVNGRAFVNNSSIGLYPFLVAERTAEQKRRGVGKLAALGPALGRTIRRSSWQTVRISAEGDRRQLRTPCVFVGNNFYNLAALGRRNTLSAGELCVYLVKPQTWLRLLLLPFKIVFGTAHPERDVELLRVKSLEINSRRRHLRVATDGETARLATPLRYRIRPAALRVLVPVPAELRPGTTGGLRKPSMAGHEVR